MNRWKALLAACCCLAVCTAGLSAQEIFEAVKAGDVARVKALLDKDAGLVNAKMPNGLTPLFLACFEKKGLEMVTLLVDRGAGVNESRKYGGTLLDAAYEYAGPEYVQYLESKGARFSPIDLRLASVRGSISRIAFGWGMLNNIGVSAGPDGLLIVDSGFSRRAAAELAKVLSGMNKGPLKVIVNSHLHGDHTAGNILAVSGVSLLDLPSLKAAGPDSGISKVSPSFQGRSGKPFDSAYALRFNGEDVLFIPYPGLHSDADILTYFSGSGIVHMGDLLLSQCCPAVQDPAGYMAFLDKVLDAFPADTIFVSGHGRDLNRDGLKKYRDDLQAMAAVVRKSFEGGKTAEDMIRADVLKAYKADYSFLDWIGPDSWISRVFKGLKGAKSN